MLFIDILCRFPKHVVAIICKSFASRVFIIEFSDDKAENIRNAFIFRKFFEFFLCRIEDESIRFK